MEKGNATHDPLFETLNAAFQKQLELCRRNLELANNLNIIPQERDRLLAINTAMLRTAERDMVKKLATPYQDDINKPIPRPIWDLVTSINRRNRNQDRG